MRNQKGFTLIELIITVVIAAILAAIAYPSYTNWVIKTRRADAQRGLMELANRLERNYLNTSPPGYTTDMTRLGYTAATDVLTSDGYYRLSVVFADTTSYRLQATPVAGTTQEKDTKCMNLTLNSLGERSATGSNPSECWQ